MMRFHGNGGNTGNHNTASTPFPTHHTTTGITTTNNKKTIGIFHQTNRRLFLSLPASSFDAHISTHFPSLLNSFNKN
jgi:hypothetical protein